MFTIGYKLNSISKHMNDIRLLLVICSLVLLSPYASAYELIDADSYDISYSNDAGTIFDQTISGIKIYDIAEWTGLNFIYCSGSVYQSPSIKTFLENNPSYSAPVLLKIGANTVGSGLAGYNALFSQSGSISLQVWVEINELDVYEYSGTQFITLVPTDGSTLYNGQKLGRNDYYTVSTSRPIGIAVGTLGDICAGTHIARSNYYWQNNIDDLGTLIELKRNIDGAAYSSTIYVNTTGGSSIQDKSVYDISIPYVGNGSWTVISPYGEVYSGVFGTTINPSNDFTLSVTPQSAAVGDPVTATLTNIPEESSRLMLNVNGVIHRDITNPYNFSAIGNSGETIYVFANCYDSSNNLLYSSNVVSYTLTGEIEPIDPHPDLDKVEITGVAPSYTQGNTLTATLNDNSIAGINEIWWKIIPQTDENGNPSTITGKRYEYKEFSTDNWQLKSGSSYTGSYTYTDVKSLSHYIDGYGLFDVEVNCYNSTNGLIAIDKVNSYANPASYIKPVSVYIYGNSGLYSGEITLTTEYIVQSKNTTYYIYNGYDTINVVKAGDYNIYVDLTDNSIYKDKVLQYSYDSDGSILRIYLEEDYTISEHAKLSVRVVDINNNPLSFANVKFVGLAESTITTNANGYAEYIGANNETVTFTASKSGYLTGEGSIKLTEAINTFVLVLPLITDTITPTVTPTTPATSTNPITNFINLIMSYGMNEEMAKLVLGLIISGGLFAVGVKFGESVGAGLAGAVLGIIFSCALNLIPMWIIVAILLCAAAILASKLYGQG